MYTKVLDVVRNSSLIKTSGVYTMSSFINASIPFLLLPILTNHLSNSDFGIISMFTGITGLMMPFIGINLEGAIARMYYKDSTKIDIYVGTCLGIGFFGFLFTTVLIFLCRGQLSKFSGISDLWVCLTPLFCFCQYVSLVLITLFQMELKPIKYGVFQITQSLFNFILTTFLIMAMAMKWEGRLISIVCSAALYFVIALIVLTRTGRVKFIINYEYIRHALNFGLGLIPHSLGASLMVITNRFFLLKMVNIEEVGFFSLASQIASILSFFTISFNNAYVPWLYQKLNNHSEFSRIKIVKNTYLYFLAISVFGFIFFSCCPLFFKYFIGMKFSSSNKYLVWLVIGFVFQGMYFMVVNYSSYVEKTSYQAFVTIFVGMLNIPLNYFLIREFNAIGSGMAFAGSFFLWFLFTWILSSRLYPMPWFKLFSGYKKI